MPLRLSTHAQRPRKQHRKDHDEANLQRAPARHEVQDGRGTDQEGDADEDEDEPDDHVDAAFAVEVEMVVVGPGGQLFGREDFLRER